MKQPGGRRKIGRVQGFRRSPGPECFHETVVLGSTQLKRSSASKHETE